MVILLFLVIGLVAAALNTAPPSATNLAVVKYTADGGLSKAKQFCYGAALGEVIVASLALSFGVLIQEIFEDNTWLKVIFILLLIAAGIFFLKKVENDHSSVPTTESIRFRNGLLLGTLNIPMFIYWIAIFSILSKYISFSQNSPWLIIILFLAGVFIGKYMMLFLYGKLSDYMIKNFTAFKGKLNKIIGIVLLAAAFIQLTKLILS